METGCGKKKLHEHVRQEEWKEMHKLRVKEVDLQASSNVRLNGMDLKIDGLTQKIADLKVLLDKLMGYLTSQRS